MKKRILSIALVVVMIVAMVPAMLINAAPYTGNINGYDTYFSASELTLDGVMDEVYANSEKIISKHCTNSSVSFEAYAVVTTTGLYVFMDIKDNDIDVEREASESTPSSDKVQIYMQCTDGTNKAYQWEEFDYAHSESVQRKDPCKYIVKADGYTLEFFKPWSDWTSLTNLSTSNLEFYFGLQVNNYVGDKNNGIAYDVTECSAYWSGSSGTNYQGWEYTMTKANIITAPKAAAADDYYYTANVVDYADITFDGEMDEAYNFTGKINPTYAHAGTIGKDVDFSTYTLATEKGIYVFASIMDDTLDKQAEVDPRDGDKFQISFSLGNTYWQRWGYVDFDYVNGGRHVVTAKSSNGFGGAAGVDVEQKTSIWDDNKGWNIEVFIPYDFCQDSNSANIGYSSGTLSQNDFTFKMNIQVNNIDVLTYNPDTGRATSTKVYGQVYDVEAALSSWSTSSCHVPVKLAREEGFGQLVYAPSITIDGVKDAGYGDASTAFVFDGRVSTNVTNASCGHDLNTSGIAWVTVTDTGIYVYAEFTDSDMNATSNPDGLRLDVSFPMSGASGYAGLGYHHSGHWTNSYTWESAANRKSFWQIYGPRTDNRLGNGMKDLGNGRYAIEFGLALPYYEQELMKAGVSFPIAIGLTYNDCCSTTNGTCHKIYSSYYWSYWGTTSSYRVNMPRWTADKSVTAASTSVASKITGANVSLGESINVNYYANVPATASNVVMKFTFNDEVTYVHATRTSATTCEFTFEGIAPQCMGDNIKAELYVDGDKVDTKAEYSVLQNVNNVKNDSNKALVEALLNYGAAAQKYAYYKTDALVNAGLEAPVYETIVNNDRTVSAETVEGARFSAAGVYHANANKIYAKVEAASAANLTVTINGKAAELEEYADGVYIVYTDDLKVTEFDKVFIFVLSDGTNSQTLTYSVNAYCAVKQNADYAKTAELAKAMYAYGLSAEAYAAK